MNKPNETVWKFPLPLVPPQPDRPVIKCPEGSEVLCLQVQLGTGPCLWMKVIPDAPVIERRFIVVGTGQDMPNEPTQYVGTWQAPPYVFHVFELV